MAERPIASESQWVRYERCGGLRMGRPPDAGYLANISEKPQVKNPLPTSATKMTGSAFSSRPDRCCSSASVDSSTPAPNALPRFVGRCSSSCDITYRVYQSKRRIPIVATG